MPTARIRELIKLDFKIKNIRERSFKIFCTLKEDNIVVSRKSEI